jgi:hypothetical protein
MVAQAQPHAAIDRTLERPDDRLVMQLIDCDVQRIARHCRVDKGQQRLPQPAREVLLGGSTSPVPDCPGRALSNCWR